MRARAAHLVAMGTVVHLSALNAIQDAPGVWRREPDMLSPRAAHAVVAAPDAIYVLTS
ncbi:MAG TPA: hypothetical protein VEK56_01115 [Vicinamibacterales bacterium]|nr:hypothetical protein [Vicinamibacterales bacterium]